MAGLDIFLLICFVPGIVSGISKGFIKQLVDLAALVGGAWAAWKFHDAVASWLQSTFTLTMEPKTLGIISFLIVVIVIVLIFNIIGALVTKMVKTIELGWLNRIAGVAFGLLKVALVLGLLISMFQGINEKWELMDPAKLNDAVVYNALIDFSDKVFPFIKSFLAGAGGNAAEVSNV